MIDGVPRPTDVHQRAGQVVMRVRVVGLQSQRLLEVFDGLVWPTELEEYCSEVVVGAGIIGLQGECALVVFGRLLGISHPERRVAERVYASASPGFNRSACSRCATASAGRPVLLRTTPRL